MLSPLFNYVQAKGAKNIEESKELESILLIIFIYLNQQLKCCGIVGSILLIISHCCRGSAFKVEALTLIRGVR